MRLGIYTFLLTYLLNRFNALTKFTIKPLYMYNIVFMATFCMTRMKKS